LGICSQLNAVTQEPRGVLSINLLISLADESVRR